MNEIELPDLRTRIGRRGKLVMPPDGRVRRYEVTDEIRLAQTGNAKKLLCLELVKFEDGVVEVRVGYYIIGKKPRMLGKWVWGQFAPLIPVNDFAALFRQAERKGWFDHLQ